MRRASICTAAFGMIGLVFVAPAAAQNMMQHVDLTSPEMTAAEMTRAEVEAVGWAPMPIRQSSPVPTEAERLTSCGDRPVSPSDGPLTFSGIVNDRTKFLSIQSNV